MSASVFFFKGEKMEDDVMIALKRITGLIDVFERGNKDLFSKEKLCKLHGVIDFAIDKYHKQFSNNKVSYSRLRLKFVLQNLNLEPEEIKKRNVFFDTVSELHFVGLEETNTDQKVIA